MSAETFKIRAAESRPEINYSGRLSYFANRINSLNTALQKVCFLGEKVYFFIRQVTATNELPERQNTAGSRLFSGRIIAEIRKR
ncbi:hypothetical protein ACFFSY_17725 [Paenibacillus aurantiacus]|uniref:Uncharacterized protein n=1 Tax=Paenibacillus aurantiacus TaxID=1936118 RepID=A0ABV5KRB5_9BACL